MGKLPTRIPNYAKEGVLAEHQNAETVSKGTATIGTAYPYYDTIANLANIISASITTTKKCLIVVVTTLFTRHTYTPTLQIERDGINKTKETTASGADANNYRQIMQYATEVLDAGAYTYALVNRDGGSVNSYGASIKIVAVEC